MQSRFGLMTSRACAHGQTSDQGQTVFKRKDGDGKKHIHNCLAASAVQKDHHWLWKRSRRSNCLLYNDLRLKRLKSYKKATEIGA
jgi:hypothetical protein